MLDVLELGAGVTDASEVTVDPCDCVDVPIEDSDTLVEGDNDPRLLAVKDWDTELVLDVLGECKAEYDCNELSDIDRHAEGVCVLAAVFVLKTEEENAAV